MSFAQEMKDFTDAFETGSRIRLNLANRQKVYESYRQMTDAEGDEIAGKYGSFNGGQGGQGVGTTTAPKQTAAGGAGVTVPNAGGEGFLKQAYGYYRKKGLSHNHAAAIAGNLQMESGGDPRVFAGVRMGDGGQSGYAAQWKGPRLTNLMSFAKQPGRGGAKPTLQDQLDFVLEEGNPQSPFRDLGAVKAHQLASQAKTADEATNAFMINFERPNEDPNVNGIAKRVGWARSLGSDDGAAGTYDFGSGYDVAGIPEEEEEDAGYPDAATGGSETPEITAENPEITVVEAAPAEIQPTFVEDEFVNQPQYARGGAIPDSQNFEDGGAPQPDPYNPSRAYTQPVTAQPQAAVARRISIPAPVSGQPGMPAGQDWRNWGSGATPGGSPAQLALREGLAARAAARKEAADKAAADAAAKAAADAAAKAAADAKKNRGWGYGNSTVVSRGNVGRGSDRGGYTTSGRSGAGSFGSRSSSASRAGGGLFEEGGAVDFKEGGPVKRRNYEYENKAGTRMMVRSRGSGGDGVEYQMGPRREKPKPAAVLKSKPTSPPKAPARPRERNVPIPTPRPPKSELETGPGGMPQVDTMGNSVGGNYPQGETFTQKEIDWQNLHGPMPNEKLNKWKKERQEANRPKNLRFRPDAGYNAQHEGPPAPAKITITVPGTEDDLEVSGGNAMGFARGGAIPDDEPSLFKRIVRGGQKPDVEAFRRKAHGDPPQTKSSKKQKPKSTTKKQARNQKKKSKPQSSRLPDEGPIPGNRPQATQSRFPDQMAAPGARPQAAAPLTGGQESAGPPGMRRPKPMLDNGREVPQPPPYSRDWRAAPGANQSPGIGGAGRPAPPPEPGMATRRGGLFDFGAAAAGEIGDAANEWINRPREPGPATRPGGYLDQAAGALRPSRGAIYGGGQPTPTGPPPGPPDEPASDPGLESTPWLAYAAGGAIPDEEGPYPNSPAEGAPPPSSADQVATAPVANGPFPPAPPAPAEQTPTQAEPPQPDFDPRQARRAAIPALQAAKRGIEKIFGIGDQDPAGVPTPEGDAARQQGLQRFARGEGAATPDEVRAADFAFGLDNVRADAGTKNLMRLEAAVHWKLQRGDKDGAEAAAASFLLYGAGQVRNAGVMAQTAFTKYQQTGNPQDLRNASLAVQKAHAMIPDGKNLKIDVDPKTRQIVATTVDDDGKQTQQVIDPAQVPQLLGSMMDGSAYWDAVEQIGQPQMALAEAKAGRDVASNAEERRYNEKLEQDRWERNQGAALEKEDRAAAAKLRERELNAMEGQTAGERRDRENEAFLTDWGEQGAGLQGDDKKKWVEEGLGYVYENAQDRDDPLADEDIARTVAGVVEQGGVIEDEDVVQLTELARMIGIKNPQLDETGAGQAAVALVMAPNFKVNRNGTLYANGADLVFNPMLLPNLSALRQKYKQ